MVAMYLCAYMFLHVWASCTQPTPSKFKNRRGRDYASYNSFWVQCRQVGIEV